MHYRLDNSSETPIYRQLADAIYRDIIAGRLGRGTKLPTVRELADEMQLARGTVKRTYEELEKLGAVEMTQGRGTFVSYQQAKPASRKDRAMAAIDEMFAKLDELGFSAGELSIYLELKLRERASEDQAVQVAVVDCNPESLSMAAAQLYGIRGIEVHALLLSEIQDRPYRLEEGMDLIITSSLHAEEVARLMSGTGKLERVVLTPDEETVVDLARLGAGRRVGIVCQSARFSGLLSRACQTYAARCEISGIFLLGVDGLRSFVQNCDTVILPQGYEKLCSEGEEEILKDMVRRKKAVLYRCVIDQGSMLHLQERIASLQNKNSSRAVRT